jgi:ribose 5-phosphate isomerase A
MPEPVNSKRDAAAAALDYVQSGMRLGIGTGSTAEEFVHLLAAKVVSGLNVVGVPTSVRTEKLCRQLGIKLATLEDMPELDLTVDGADEVDGDLNLIKGAGGALLREKIVAAASSRMIVIADASKKVETLGAFKLPIEVNPFGLATLANRLLQMVDTCCLMHLLAAFQRQRTYKLL